MGRLCCNPVDSDFLLLLSKAGVLFSVQGLLTPYRAEAGMWSDMAVAIEDLAAVKFLLVPVSATSDQPKDGDSANCSLFPQVHGNRDAVQVSWGRVRHLYLLLIDCFFTLALGHNSCSYCRVFRSSGRSCQARCR